jgi:outer membrane immunogenic protein
MRFITLQKLLLITLLSLSASLFADDKISWDGAYGSLMLGRTFGNAGEGNGDMKYLLDPPPGTYDYNMFGNGGSSIKGWGGSIKLGMNKQINDNLIGIELGGTWQDTKANGQAFSSYYDIPALFTGPTDTLTSKTKVNTYETAALRFGHIFNKTTLVYALGGLSVGQIKRTITAINNDWFDAGTVMNDNKTELGYVLGFGVEHKLDNRWSLRANYEYVDFGDVEFKYSGPYTTNPGYLTPSFNQFNSIHFSNLSAGVSYAF